MVVHLGGVLDRNVVNMVVAVVVAVRFVVAVVDIAVAAIVDIGVGIAALHIRIALAVVVVEETLSCGAVVQGHRGVVLLVVHRRRGVVVVAAADVPATPASLETPNARQHVRHRFVYAWDFAKKGFAIVGALGTTKDSGFANADDGRDCDFASCADGGCHDRARLYRVGGLCRIARALGGHVESDCASGHGATADLDCDDGDGLDRLDDHHARHDHHDHHDRDGCHDADLQNCGVGWGTVGARDRVTAASNA
jgi:hypothetical protein